MVRVWQKPPLFSSAPGDVNQLANQRDSEREGRQQNVLHQIRTLLDPVVLHVGLTLLHGNHGSDVLQEIDAAFFAHAAVPLLVMARRTLKSQRRMAPLAEARHVAGFSAAFRAFHGFILAGGARGVREVRRGLRPRR
jgi:hypothetical protein